VAQPEALLASKPARVRAWLLNDGLDHLWRSKSVHWAGAFLDYGCAPAMRSRRKPVEKGARLLRKHEAMLLNSSPARPRSLPVRRWRG
jgi:hypothetical protein